MLLTVRGWTSLEDLVFRCKFSFGYSLQVPELPPDMQWDEADLEPICQFLQWAASTGEFVPSPGLSFSTRPVL